MAWALLFALTCVGCGQPANLNAPVAPMKQSVTEPVAPLQQPAVISWGETTMSNTQLAYYYWSEYFLLLQMYGQQLPANLDTTKPLADQMYDQTSTWEDYVLSRTLETVEKTMSMVFDAQKSGFALPTSYADNLATVMEEFGYKAVQMGFSQDGTPDLEAYFQDSYGPSATVDSFTAYLEDAYLAAAYSDFLYAAPQFTQEEILNYYGDHGAEYEQRGVLQEDTLLPTIRTILFAPKDVTNDEVWNQAKQSAQTLYDTWRADGGTESDFSALASAHSQDKATSSKGGLMEAVTPQAISGELANWVFDPARQPGDSAVLSTDTGWAIAYYVAVGTSSAWEMECQRDLRDETYDLAVEEILKQYPMEFEQDLVDIPTPNGLFTTP